MLSAWEAWPSFSWLVCVSSFWDLFVSEFLCIGHLWPTHHRLRHQGCHSKVKSRYRLRLLESLPLWLSLSLRVRFHRRGPLRWCGGTAQSARAPHFSVAQSALAWVVLVSNCTPSTFPCRFSNCSSKTSSFAFELRSCSPMTSLQGH